MQPTIDVTSGKVSTNRAARCCSTYFIAGASQDILARYRCTAFRQFFGAGDKQSDRDAFPCKPAARAVSPKFARRGGGEVSFYERIGSAFFVARFTSNGALCYESGGAENSVLERIARGAKPQSNGVATGRAAPCDL
jgi:hypothetical protein